MAAQVAPPRRHRSCQKPERSITTSNNLKPEQVQEQKTVEVARKIDAEDTNFPTFAAPEPPQEEARPAAAPAVLFFPEEVAEVEGLRAALGGCAGTHNPHMFGDPALREAWARGMRQLHAYRDRELEIQAGRMPLQELRALLRAVFLGAEGQDVAREAGRLFDALASVPLLPVPEASGGAGGASRNDTPERSDP